MKRRDFMRLTAINTAVSLLHCLVKTANRKSSFSLAMTGLYYTKDSLGCWGYNNTFTQR